MPTNRDLVDSLRKALVDWRKTGTYPKHLPEIVDEVDRRLCPQPSGVEPKRLG